MELFEEIRREYEFGEGTIQGIARKLHVHRRMVRQAVLNAVPSPRKKTVRPHWKLKPAIPFIDTILKTDRTAPRKQRHTAHRIWRRSVIKYISELQREGFCTVEPGRNQHNRTCFEIPRRVLAL